MPDEVDDAEVPVTRRRRRHRKRKRRSRRSANFAYNLKWLIGTLAVGLPLLAILIYLAR